MSISTPLADVHVVQNCATQTALNRCLHEACLLTFPAQYGNGASNGG